MSVEQWLESRVEYGCDLLRSAVAGACAVEEQIGKEASRSGVLSRSAATAVAAGASTACLGAVAGYFMSRRRPTQIAITLGLVGAMLGFTGGMMWGTRQVTGQIARGALKNVNAVRDAHWLQRHPIDYA